MKGNHLKRRVRSSKGKRNNSRRSFKKKEEKKGDERREKREHEATSPAPNRRPACKYARETLKKEGKKASKGRVQGPRHIQKGMWQAPQKKKEEGEEGPN